MPNNVETKSVTSFKEQLINGEITLLESYRNRLGSEWLIDKLKNKTVYTFTNVPAVKLHTTDQIICQIVVYNDTHVGYTDIFNKDYINVYIQYSENLKIGGYLPIDRFHSEEGLFDWVLKLMDKLEFSIKIPLIKYRQQIETDIASITETRCGLPRQLHRPVRNIAETNKATYHDLPSERDIRIMLGLDNKQLDVIYTPIQNTFKRFIHFMKSKLRHKPYELYIHKGDDGLNVSFYISTKKRQRCVNGYVNPFFTNIQTLGKLKHVLDICKRYIEESK